ncbi:uncharacterized protein Nmag_0902 [Natrialba magadii ATCC 43099]|uniref:Uncharacterized protein n=1 Tax=Natrialba magadii (strain ATCC 43099 / DSM 3394 / CCM 3739 / CIP 104546 / IAM 13178 / JCM 8861 / NBRC 102185 / NCIMB 2190 / MS3) TaxID=547559 RepID=D3SQJ8_NATMM|nr:hypothetical protein [Natrialba magadii]ADD04486.1 uncharacterized protein Nmag_0902 [Natrialba magadii ATCC 43099]ELY25881.1 hypothetical protein C500_17024 [Natrialba magadii ATCC 43099]
MTTNESQSTEMKRNRNRTNRTNAAQKMGEVSHTNPYTGETAGNLFNRGPIVATDGGRPAATDPKSRRADDSAADAPAEANANADTMRDVSHTPPNGTDDANRVFERGRTTQTEGAGRADTDTDTGVAEE